MTGLLIYAHTHTHRKTGTHTHAHPAHTGCFESSLVSQESEWLCQSYQQSARAREPSTERQEISHFYLLLTRCIILTLLWLLTLNSAQQTTCYCHEM